MTTNREACELMLTHHQLLGEQVESRVEEVTRVVATGAASGPVVAELVACLADEVLPHAMAEEHTIYGAAARRKELSGTVAEMVGEHRMLAAATERLALAPDGDRAASLAQEIGALFSAHLAKENEILLPPLVADDDVDLEKLLVQMHRLVEAATEETSNPDDLVTPDVEVVVASLLVEAATDLASAGLGDRACRLVASAWATLRVPRPDLAVRLTAALHRLSRLANAEPVSFGSSSVVGERTGGPDLDVRHQAPAQRHQSILAEYEALVPGTGFVLVNDHDPKPLRYQFEAEYPGEFTWDTLEAGPSVWRVRIGRPTDEGAAAPGRTKTAATDDEPELDVRQLAHGHRHDTIFVTYQALARGAGFVLVNDHDPKPLRYQFEAEYPGEFTWEYIEAGPRRWRVRIGRAPAEAVR